MLRLSCQTCLLALFSWLSVGAGLSLQTLFLDQAGRWLQPAQAQEHVASLVSADQLRETGLRQFQANQIELGIQNLERAVARYRTAGALQREASALDNLSYMHLATGQYAEAIAAAERWLVIAQQQGATEDTVKAHIRLGWGHAYFGQYADAQDSFEFVRQQSYDRGDTIARIDALSGLGWVSAYLGDYPAAQRYHQRALDLARTRNDLSRQGYAWGGLGWAALQANQEETAIAAYQQQLALARQAKDARNEANALGKLGEAYQQAQQVTPAVQSLEAGLMLLRRLGDRRGEGYVLLRLAEIQLDQGQGAKGLALLQQALGVHRAIGNRRGEAITLNRLAQLLAEQDRTTAAIALYKDAVSTIETIRHDIDRLSREQRNAYRDTVADTYRSLVALLLDQGRVLEAQQVLELLKGNELEEFTNERRSGSASATNLPRSSGESQVSIQLGGALALGYEIEDCLASHCNELSTLLDRRDRENEDFYAAIDSLETEVQQRLSQDRGVLDTEDFSRAARAVVQAEPNTILIYPFIAKDSLWLLWGGPGGINGSIEVPVSERELSQTILDLRQLLESPTSNVSALQKQSKRLHDWLIAPLASELDANQIENLVFSLDRQLRYVPMAVLFDGEQYLVERYDIHNILSADLTNTDASLDWQQQDVQVLAVGLSKAVANFSALPAVPLEIDAIVREQTADPQGIFAGIAFLDEAFSKAALRDNLWGHQVLHIATHGTFVPGEQDASYLVLGDGTPLPIREIRRFEGLANLHLVVLSACETALGGTNQDGIEISSLAYQFLNKGTKSVIASLWAVSDRSTSILMQTFYQTLASRDRASTKAEALRQAQLRLLKGEGIDTADRQRGLGIEPTENASVRSRSNYQHPYYWAPFILMGNGL